MFRLLAISLVTALCTQSAFAQSSSFFTPNELNYLSSVDADTPAEDEQNSCTRDHLRAACGVLEGCYLALREDPNLRDAQAVIDACLAKVGCNMRRKIDSCDLTFEVYINRNDNGTVTGLLCNNPDITGIGVRGISAGSVSGIPSQAICDKKLVALEITEAP
jgi:hypothetical protein